MALTRITKIGDGVTSVFNVTFALGYVSQSHVKARVAGEVDGLGAIIYRTITFDSVEMLRLSGDPPGNGVEVYFERTVPKTALLVEFSDGDELSEGNLDLVQLQLMHIAQEAIDGRIGPIASNFDMNGFRIRNIGEPVDDDDLATRAFVLGNSEGGGAGGAAGAEAGAAAAAAAIAALVVDSDQIGTSAVLTNNINDGAVTAPKLATGAVQTDKVGDNQIDARCISASDIAAIVTKLGLDSKVTPVGTIIDSISLATPAGYLKVNGTTIGSAGSGATQRANADTLALYTMLWAYDNSVLPIQTSTGTAGTRGVSALSDFNADKRMPLFDLRGVFRRGFDDGRGKDAARVAGSVQADGIKAHVHAQTNPDHGHEWRINQQSNGDGDSTGGIMVNFDGSKSNKPAYTGPLSDTGGQQIGKGGAYTGDTASNTGATADTRPENLAFPVYIKY